MTLGIIYILSCTLSEKQSRVVLTKISWKFTVIRRIELEIFKNHKIPEKIWYFKHVLYQQTYLELTANFTCEIFLQVYHVSCLKIACFHRFWLMVQRNSRAPTRPQNFNVCKVTTEKNLGQSLSFNVSE